jgi:large subunit ribosomal protein L15
MPSRTKKFRGLRTHGRGIKAGRGAGKQGGRGNAGLHKYKFKSMLIYAPDHFGRHGFKRPPGAVDRTTSLNVGDLDAFVPILEAAGALSKEGDTFVGDLTKAGVDRLLGGGGTARAWKVVVAHATKHAKEKVTVVAGAPSAAAS